MKTIMIVEDEYMIANFLHSIIINNFADKFSQVLVCCDGREALEKAKNFKIDVLILDLTLPGINGINIHQTLKSRNSNIYTIVISAHQEFHYLHEAMELGVRKYFLKPVRPEFLVEQLSLYLKTEVTSEPTLPMDIKSDVIKEAINFLHQHYLERITLESVSEFIYLNPQYFSRLFKKELGMSFVDYLNSLRVQHSCQLLRETNYPVYRIAAESGFSDAPYFTRVFAKHMNTTPNEYRKLKNLQVSNS